MPSVKCKPLCSGTIVFYYKVWYAWAAIQCLKLVLYSRIITGFVVVFLLTRTFNTTTKLMLGFVVLVKPDFNRNAYTNTCTCRVSKNLHKQSVLFQIWNWSHNWMSVALRGNGKTNINTTVVISQLKTHCNLRYNIITIEKNPLCVF